MSIPLAEGFEGNLVCYVWEEPVNRANLPASSNPLAFRPLPRQTQSEPQIIYAR